MYIYIATNTINTKQYVGQSVKDPHGHRGRIHEHRLAKNKSLFHKAIRKHGFDNFTWEVIYYPGASQDALNAIERWHIAKLGSLVPNGYNLETGGKSGGKLSPEARANLSAAHKGKIISPEHRSKLSKTLKGRIISPEHRAKISDGLRGRNFSDEHRAKISDARRGKPLSPEHRAKISDGLRGDKHPLYGKTHSPKSRAKMSAAHKGKSFSPETRAKMSKSQRKRRWQEKNHPDQMLIEFPE